ncbi:IS5 family transposase [Noviherbaspirillum malthae]|uniref:IS5 family transposase n=1 Tax=Noviherbaspirillum malthae TaxID=1260987 RepID=UPI003F69C32C
MSRKYYPSDISREQFDQVRPLLEGSRKRTNPRNVDLYDIFCAILYLLKNAATWRALPSDFPPVSTVRYYFDAWTRIPDNSHMSLLDQCLKKIGGARAQEKCGRLPLTSFCIVDAQSVKNTDTARHKGYDAGKKVSGIKRHIAVDTQGLPHAIMVTTAEVNDRNGALLMFAAHDDRLAQVKQVLVDGGYTGERFENLTYQTLGAKVQVAKRNELHTFAVIPQRWVVERSFAWLEKCRRLWKNCERKLHTSEQFIVLAFLALLLKRY